MKLLLVDGHYFLYRSFFAIRGLSNSKGIPTNAIYGFAKALRKMIVDVQPDLGAVVWDAGLPARRVALQPQYKQQRPPMPDEMRSQEEWLQERVALFGMASLSLPNTEADDIIATYALDAAAQGIESVVATNDKDILQIVNDRIKIYSSGKAWGGKDGFGLLGAAEVTEKWSVEPAQIGDVLALTGDSSDNIPGVPGVGEKTAAKLIREHGSIEALYQALDSVPNAALREKLAACRDLVAANREMVRLDTVSPLPAPLDSLKIVPRYSELIEALRECEFKGLLQEVEAEAGKLGGVSLAKTESAVAQGEFPL